MRLAGVEVRCPRCRGELRRAGGNDADRLLCGECAAAYPIVAGIPDLRIAADPYIGLEEDRDKARRLAERTGGLDLAATIDFYYRSTPAVPPHHARLYARGLLAAEARAGSFLDLLGPGNDGGPGGPFLDLGCGTAPLAVVAAARGHRVVGVDIALRWLVVAARRLAERGVEAPLICACAEALPFAAESFATVGGESVLDQVGDQPATLGECHRVLRAGGRLLLSTPNRFSLGPDPQTGIWAGSWLPARAVAAIVRRQGGIPPRRRLLSGRELRRLLVAAGFEPSRVLTPEIPAAQRRRLPPVQRAAALAYGAARASPGTRQLLRAIGPLLITAARKPAPAGDAA